MKNFEPIDRCVILMAGKGTRFLPATRAVAKELFPIENKPALLYQLLEIYKSGITKVCLVISKEKEHVKKFLSHDKKLEEGLKNSGKLSLLKELNEVIDNMQFTFIYQGKKMGTGAALEYAKKWTKGKPFAFLYGDDFCKVGKGKTPAIGQLVKAYEKTGKTVVGAKPFPMDVIHNYSSIVKRKQLFERCHEMINIIEKPEKGKAPSNLVGLARYVFTPEIFDEIAKCPTIGGEVRLTDAISSLSQKERAVCFEFDATYYDCGNKLEYIKCILDFALEDEEISDKLMGHLKSLTANSKSTKSEILHKISNTSHK